MFFVRAPLPPHGCPPASLFNNTSPGGDRVENPPASTGDIRGRVRSLGWEDLLEREMATHSNILAWKSPWTEEPGRLKSMGPQRVRHNWAHLVRARGELALGRGARLQAAL